MSADLDNKIKRELVEKAEEILTGAAGRSGFGDATAQLRNLVQITQEETEVPVLQNFIRYQAGRRATQKFWGLIADSVIEFLGALDERKDLTADQRTAAIRNFFGYLVRHYVYLEAIRKGDLRPAPAAGRGDRS